MTVITIPLQASLKADLNWTQAKAAARSHLETGGMITWDLQLGLFHQMHHPFSHQSQFLSLALSLEHFAADIWPEFKENTSTVCLYKGPADYSYNFPWDDLQTGNLREWLKERLQTLQALQEESGIPFHSYDEVLPVLLKTTRLGQRLLSLFCRDACVGYLTLLAARVTDEIPFTVELDAAGIEDPALLAQLMSREAYERIAPLCPEETNSFQAKVAVCLPPIDMIKQQAIAGLSQAMQALENRGIPFKIIPETQLITEWDELDTLIVCAEGLGPQGYRKLQGFCAAGGLAAVLGPPLRLTQEQPFAEWLEQL